jgi:hypothetical protein
MTTSAFGIVLTLVIVLGLPATLMFRVVRCYWLMTQGKDRPFDRVLAFNGTAVVGTLAAAFAMVSAWSTLQSPSTLRVVWWSWVAACVLPALFVAYLAPVGWQRRLRSFALCAVCTLYPLMALLVSACLDPRCVWP